ncbi:hypothetical protein GCM10009853_054870 [Glycomyces scopariae]|uniref:Uncharacterized protein n=1 Tax=Glycomyces sambucus TaxID=380244 RepID=A0A1G9LBT3_9ACTN|nr:hypothetical protein [Glycomyces sambucus]SDL59344.1 hypothetical protein SAMN05216298_4412 [Glycomyces sambucus]
MRARGLETAVRVGGAVVAAAAAVLAALIEAFLVPTYWDGIAIPLAGALAFAGNWSLAALAVWWTGSRWGALLTSLAWFAVVLAASMPSSAGSLVVASGFNGYALLLAGTAGIGVALWRYFRPRPSKAPSAPKESRQ